VVAAGNTRCLHFLKATLQTLTADSIGRSRVSVFTELIKARLTTLVLITTLVGFYMGTSGPLDLVLLLHAMLGTALLAAGAAALNQLLERDLDARMARTADRPLPAGLLQPQTVLLLGVGMSIAGMVELATMVNPLTALLGAATLGSYLFVYTPLKCRTPLNTLVGAIPGALPPLMGWTAATGQVSAGGWSLFTLLFVWQLPHFMAIAWMYRDDYAKAGFKMLSALDSDGSRTAAAGVRYTLALLPFSLAPVALHIAGRFYAVGAILLGVGFLALAIQFARSRTRERARQFFFASILYLPLVLGLLVFDKIKS